MQDMGRGGGERGLRGEKGGGWWVKWERGLSLGFMVYGLWFMVYGLGFRV
jgi:hypothetical protein